MIVRTNLIPELIEADENYNADFQLIDGYMKPSEFFNINSAKAGEIQLDDNWENDKDASLNWRLIGGKSYKQCQLDGLENQPPLDLGVKFVECDLVNAHWYRNF